jgi:DNA modification methylase
MTMPEAKILVGDCVEVMRGLPAESVHCVVTSPPYWGLRDYGCEGQIGLEESPAEFVAAMVEVFREVWRVLRRDGTAWVNLGDSYAANSTGSAQSGLKKLAQDYRPGSKRDKHAYSDREDIYVAKKVPNGLKPKDKVGIPWRVAFALQDAGWFLRQDIIWHKPNPLPESVRDRCTTAHEYVFLLTKEERYFFDAEAIKESASESTHARISQANFANQKGGPKDYAATGQNGNRSMRRTLENYARASGVNPKAAAGAVGNRQNESFSAATCGPVASRNKRSVWSIPSAPYKGAHFATFPPALVKPCVLAGTSAHGCCSACSAPFVRVVVKGEADLEHQRACGGDLDGEYHGRATKDFGAARAQDASATKARILAGMRERVTTGWRPGCECKGAGRVPAVVLDPFAGSGTTGAVALELGRSAVMIELNPVYAELIRERLQVTPGLAL